MIAEESGERSYAARISGGRRRGWIVLCGRSGLSRLPLPGSPEEMALSATAVTEVTLKDAQKLPAGSVLMFKFGTSPAMLIHHEDGRGIALTAVCTHLGCTVQYEPQADRIHCACHGGVYNPYTGANVSGPPPKPLKLFKVCSRTKLRVRSLHRRDINDKKDSKRHDVKDHATLFTTGSMSAWASRSWPPLRARRPFRFTRNPSGTTGAASRCSSSWCSASRACCCWSITGRARRRTSRSGRSRS